MSDWIDWDTERAMKAVIADQVVMAKSENVTVRVSPSSATMLKALAAQWKFSISDFEGSCISNHLAHMMLALEDDDFDETAVGEHGPMSVGRNLEDMGLIEQNRKLLLSFGDSEAADCEARVDANNPEEK